MSDRSAMILEINCKETTETMPTWEFSNTLLNKQWVIEDIKKEIRQSLESVIMPEQHIRSKGIQHSSPKKEVYSFECSHQKKTEQVPINNLVMYLKVLEKEIQSWWKERKCKEITREKLVKLRLKNIEELKTWFLERISKIATVLANLINDRKKRDWNQYN